MIGPRGEKGQQGGSNGVRDIKVDGREAPIRAATVRERMPATELASAPRPREGTPSRLCLAAWTTPAEGGASEFRAYPRRASLLVNQRNADRVNAQRIPLNRKWQQIGRASCRERV